MVWFCKHLSENNKTASRLLLPFFIIIAKRLIHLTRDAIKNEIKRYISTPDLRAIAKGFKRSYECVRLIFQEILDSQDLSRAEYITESLKREEERLLEMRERQKEEKED